MNQSGLGEGGRRCTVFCDVENVVLDTESVATSQEIGSLSSSAGGMVRPFTRSSAAEEISPVVGRRVLPNEVEILKENAQGDPRPRFQG